MGNLEWLCVGHVAGSLNHGWSCLSVLFMLWCFSEDDTYLGRYIHPSMYINLSVFAKTVTLAGFQEGR